MSHRILAVDSSNSQTSLVLAEDGQLLWSQDCTQRDNLGWLRTSALQALADLSWDRSSLDALAVAKGPGALTGVRVGVGFVQALGMGLQRPVHGVNTLVALAASSEVPASPTEIKVALDARMGQLYAARVLTGSWELCEELLTEPEAVLANWGAGDYRGPGWAAYAHLLSGQQTCLSDAGPHARGLVRAYASAPALPAQDIQVHYLRREVAKVPERIKPAAPS